MSFSRSAVRPLKTTKSREPREQVRTTLCLCVLVREKPAVRKALTAATRFSVGGRAGLCFAVLY